MPEPADDTFAALLDAQRAWFEAWGRVWSGGLTINAPVYFPFGDRFTLYANPTTNWWADLATADRAAEQRIVTGVASYGKQLGKIMDIVIALAEASSDVPAGDLADLIRIRDDIEKAKRAPTV